MLNGTVIKDQWRLLNKIGEGAFGEIYSTKNILTSEIAAIKLERVDAKKQVLKLEVAVLKKLQSCQYVCRLIACGRHQEWNYLVMDLLGENLSELRKNAGGRFDLRTTLRIGIRLIAILEEIHNLGHIHRDIKPSNFVIGLQPDKRRDIFLIDWGLARRFVTSDGIIRPQRDATGFRGTARYASINSHLGKDLSRRDDLWSVFFILVEFAKGALPWRRLKDKDKIGEMKIEFNNPDLVRGLPAEFTSFMDYLQALNYEDKPDYKHLGELLTSAFERLGGSEDDKLPWEDASPAKLLAKYTSDINVALVSGEESLEAGSVSTGRSTHSKPESSSGSRATSGPPQKFILLRGKGDHGGAVAVVKSAKTLVASPYLSPRGTGTNTSPRSHPNGRGSVELEVSVRESDLDPGDVQISLDETLNHPYKNKSRKRHSHHYDADDDQDHNDNDDQDGDDGGEDDGDLELAGAPSANSSKDGDSPLHKQCRPRQRTGATRRSSDHHDLKKEGTATGTSTTAAGSRVGADTSESVSVAESSSTLGGTDAAASMAGNNHQTRRKGKKKKRSNMTNTDDTHPNNSSSSCFCRCSNSKHCTSCGTCNLL